MAKSAEEIRADLERLKAERTQEVCDASTLVESSKADSTQASREAREAALGRQQFKADSRGGQSSFERETRMQTKGREQPRSSAQSISWSGEKPYRSPIGRAVDIHHTPPHSVEAEQGVLGSMLCEPRIAIPIAQQALSMESFYVPAHVTIFNALVDMFENDGAVDLITFTQYLRDMGQLAQVGGPAFVTELYTFVPTSANIQYYVEIVKDKYIARRLIAEATETVQLAHEPTTDVATLVKHVEGQNTWLMTLSLPQKGRLTLRTPGELIGMTFDETDNFFGDRILAGGQACTLLGPGGVGKSRLSLQLAVCMIAERAFIEMPTRAKGKKWLFIQTENSNRRLHYDLKNMVSALDLTSDEAADVNRLLFIHTLEHDSDYFLNLRNPANYAAVNTLVQEVQPDFVVWDPLNSLTDSDLNSDMDMRALICAISAITRVGNSDRIALILHHSLTGKIGAARAIGWDKTSYGRNSKALQAWTRAQINLAPRSGDNPNLLIMSCGKNNNGTFFPDIGLRFDEQLGIYVKDDSFDPEEFRQDVGITSLKRKTVTVEDVVALCEDGIPKPKLVLRIKEEFGIQQRAAYDALTRAEAAGRIKKDKNKNWPSTYSVVRSERADYDN